MSKPIVISFPHGATAAEARAKADEAARKLFEQYAQQLSENKIAWTGNHADVVVGAIGQKFRGEVDISDDMVTVTVHLPWILAPLRETVTRFLQSNATALKLTDRR
jgi:hypothetical protein